MSSPRCTKKLRPVVKLQESDQSERPSSNVDSSPLCVKKKIRRVARQRKGLPKTVSSQETATSGATKQTGTNDSTEQRISVIKPKFRGKTIDSLRVLVPKKPTTRSAKKTKNSDSAGSDSPIFNNMDAAWNFYMHPSSEFHNVPNDYEPIPFHLAIRGAAIDADGFEESDAARASQPDVKTTDATMEPQQKRRSKRKKRSTVNTAGSGVVGPDSPQMKVIQRMLIYLQETIVDEHQVYLSALATVVRFCLERYTSGESKFKHLPAIIFDEAVECMGGPAFRDIFVKSKSLQTHPRLQESIESILNTIASTGKGTESERLNQPLPKVKTERFSQEETGI